MAKRKFDVCFLISLSGYGEKINCKSHSKIASPDHNSWLIFFVPLIFLGLENDCLAKPCSNTYLSTAIFCTRQASWGYVWMAKFCSTATPIYGSDESPKEESQVVRNSKILCSYRPC
ncbi:hypothetical protein OIU76_023484 [Salix suchowensis]|nr:hypothetical protein OIU76_023484 [Salix suchowensis]